MSCDAVSTGMALRLSCFSASSCSGRSLLVQQKALLLSHFFNFFLQCIFWKSLMLKQPIYSSQEGFFSLQSNESFPICQTQKCCMSLLQFWLLISCNQLRCSWACKKFANCPCWEMGWDNNLPHFPFSRYQRKRKSEKFWSTNWVM